MWAFIPRIYIATTVNSSRTIQLKKDLEHLGVIKYELNEQVPPDKKTKESVTLSCTSNHLSIYRKALKEGHKFICVFEDDVYSDINIEALREGLMEVQMFTLMRNGWDFLFLGHFPWMISTPIISNSKIHKSVSWCTHAYLISEQGMKKMLQTTPEQMLKIGRTCVPGIYSMFFSEGGGIDTFIAYSTYRRFFESYCVAPMLIYQRSIKEWKTKARCVEWICMQLPNTWWIDVVFRCVWVLLWLLIWILS